MSDPKPIEAVNPATGQAYSQGAPPVGEDILKGAHAVENWWTKHFGKEAMYPIAHQATEQVAAGHPAQGPTSGRAGFELGHPAQGPMNKQQVEQQSQTGAEVLSQAANPTNWIMAANPESFAAKAGLFAGVPAAQAMLSRDSHEQGAALLWSGVTAGLLGLGHLGPLREALGAAVPGLGQGIKQAINLNDLAKKMAENPFAKGIPDHVQQALDAANEELSKRPALGKGIGSAGERDPETGQIKFALTDEQRKKRSAFLKSFGVKDEAGFTNYVKMRGGLTPDETAHLEKNYKNLLFTNPLFSEDLPPGEFIDPRQHLDPLKQENPEAHGRAIQATTNFHILYEMAERGPHAADNPAVGILRGAVGWNHSLDLFEKQFVDSLKTIDPTLNGEKLASIIERGPDAQEEYDGLSSAGKYVVDMYRLYSHTTNVFERKAGLRVGQVGNYVPRIAHDLPRTKGGGKSAGVLVQDFQKSRLWRVEAQPTVAHVAAGDLEPIRRQLGTLGGKLSEEELAALHQIGQKLNEEDSQALMQSLRDAHSQSAASKMIETWVQNIQDKAPEDMRLRLVPAFKTISELNSHLADRRKQFAEALLQAPADAVKLSKAEAGAEINLKMPEVARIVREQDAKAAATLAARLFTPKRTDLFDILGSGHFARQMKAAHAAETVKQLEQSVVEFKDQTTGQKTNGLAAVKKSQDPRANQLYHQQGYRQVAEQTLGPYQNYIFAKPVADFIDRGSRMRDLGFFDKLGTLEQKAIGLIMYNPLFHGWNIAGRVMAYGMSHPFMMAHYLKEGKALQPGMKDQASQLLRMEAYMNGVVTPHAARNVAGDMASGLANSLGDESLHDLSVSRETPISKALAKVPGLGKVRSANESLQRVLWNSISDFGVAVYHMEKESAVRAGVDEGNAARWAARRANTWMGHVSELDHNPNLHALSRLVMFAPNYWRTFAEQLVPVYMHSGIQWTPEMTGYVARQQVATIMSLLAMQKLSGNAMNFALSGHSQFQNSAGNQDKVEVSRPQVLQALKAVGWPGADKIDSQTGEDPKTGGRLVMDNPLARQVRAGEEALGLQSGHADWQPSDALGGTAKVLAARLSPLANSAATLGNLDLYNTISTGTIRNINPDHANPDGWNLAYAAMALTPLGLSASSMAHEISSQKTPGQMQQGPFGTTVPKWVNDTLGNARSLPMNVMSALTGVSAPYESSPRGRGQAVGDDTYRKLNQLNSTYQTHTQGLSARVLSGQMTPQQWQQAHAKMADEHRVQVQALIGGTADYTQGTMGMVAQYEDLYNQATDPATGQLDPDTLARLQSDFNSHHSQAELNAMTAELNKNVQKDPVRALYKQTMDSYYSWQQQWAQQRGLSVQKLQDESRQYGTLSRSDPRAAKQFLAQHPELHQFQNAKTHQFERTPQGRLYGLFFGISSVTRYINTQHLTPLAAMQQEQALARAGVGQ